MIKTKVLSKVNNLPENTMSELEGLKGKIDSIEKEVGSIEMVASEILMSDGNNVEESIKAGQRHKLTADNGSCHLLEDGIDFNSLVNNGQYNGQKLINSPLNSDGWWYVDVKRHSNGVSYVYQMATTLSDATIAKFERHCNGGTWSAWRRL